jgi:hypothetical protein
MLKILNKKSVPGPGKYNQKRLFDDIVPKETDFFGIEPERPPFGVQAKVNLFNYWVFILIFKMIIESNPLCKQINLFRYFVSFILAFRCTKKSTTRTR